MSYEMCHFTLTLGGKRYIVIPSLAGATAAPLALRRFRHAIDAPGRFLLSRRRAGGFGGRFFCSQGVALTTSISISALTHSKYVMSYEL
jgi:hypothetical protein